MNKKKGTDYSTSSLIILSILIVYVVLSLIGVIFIIPGNDKSPDPVINQEQARKQINSAISARAVLMQVIETNQASTPKPTIDPYAELLTYVSTILNKASNCSQAIDNLVDIYEQKSENRYSSEYIAQFDLFCTNFGQESVPAYAITANEYLKQADEQYQFHVDSMLLFIQDYDFSLLETAYIDNGTHFVGLATGEIEAIISCIVG